MDTFSRFHIAGFTYYDGAEVFYKLKIGTVLTLVAEPENQFDPYATAIYFQDHKLGYIPRDQNKEIHKFLLLGHNDIFIARINSVVESENPERQIGVTVKIKAKNPVKQ
ncbi:MAG: HIRAN domain-containing protein [Helicobacteraceae bacterium]|nr:HIRAN domain-containing protein [Helicobacteraceae bacterium]